MTEWMMKRKLFTSFEILEVHVLPFKVGEPYYRYSVKFRRVKCTWMITRSSIYVGLGFRIWSHVSCKWWNVVLVWYYHLKWKYKNLAQNSNKVIKLVLCAWGRVSWVRSWGQENMEVQRHEMWKVKLQLQESGSWNILPNEFNQRISNFIKCGSSKIALHNDLTRYINEFHSRLICFTFYI